MVRVWPLKVHTRIEKGKMGSSYHRASLEIREKAFALFKLGYGYKHSAEELGVNVHTVRDWFRMFRRGHSDTVFNIRSTTAYDLSIRKKVIAERRRDNTPFAQLSEEYGVPASTIRKWMKREDEKDRWSETREK